MILGNDEVGNQYIDVKGVKWEVTESIYANYKLSHTHGVVCGVLYCLQRVDGVSKIHCFYNGFFCKRVDNVFVLDGGSLYEKVT